MKLDLDIDALKHSIEEKEDVVLAYLFGSTARGQMNPLSDVDIGVLLSREVPPEAYLSHQLNLIGQITKDLRRDDVDVVILNEAPIVLKFQVVKDGKLLYAVDEITRIRFEVEIIKAYIDFKPMLREHDLCLFENIKQRRYGDRLRRYQRTPG